MEDKKNLTNEKIAINVSITTIFVNVILSAFKLFAGIIASSGAMISDAVHSASDVFSTFIVIAGVKIAGKEADENHQYGHERIECVAAIILAIILCATGIGIGMNGVNKIRAGISSDLEIPGILALLAAIFSIVIKEGMYWYTKIAAKKINSGSLMADAWHHRSDAFSSIGSFVGILGARLGYPIMDPIAGAVICIFIVKASVDIFVDSIKKLTDESCDLEIEEAMKKVILRNIGVLGIDLIRTRKFASKIYVDIEILVDGHMTLINSHNIAEEVHDSIEANFSQVKHCMVHVNPLVSFSED